MINCNSCDFMKETKTGKKFYCLVKGCRIFPENIQCGRGCADHSYYQDKENDDDSDPPTGHA